jgi:preprotein translocase subunit YajC
VQVADTVKIKFDRSAIASIVKEGEAAPAEKK